MNQIMSYYNEMLEESENNTIFSLKPFIETKQYNRKLLREGLR
jgi:hypothetical protein